MKGKGERGEEEGDGGKVRESKVGVRGGERERGDG